MVTKEQERKALEQIEKIVSALGADSYIATAFDGCFEDARENIENDFALCMKDRYETERKRAEDLQAEVDRLKADLRKEKEVSEELGQAIKKSREQENAEIQALHTELQKAITDAKAEKAFRAAEASKKKETQERVKELEGEVIRLKAELYDYMVREREEKRDV